MIRRLLTILLAARLAVGTAEAQPGKADFGRDIRPLIKNSCLECHSARAKRGGLDLERFGSDAAVMGDRAAWKAVFDRVEARQMPPRNAAIELADAERQRLLAWVAEVQARPDPKLGTRDPGKPVLRRLTRLEYNNTVRDLLGLPTDVFMFPERLPLAHKRYFHPESGRMGDRLETAMREYGAKYPVLLPQSGLPGDNRAEHGFANRGDALNLSPLLLEKYLALAAEIVNSPGTPRASPRFAELIGVGVPDGARAPTGRPAGPVAAVGWFAPKDNVKAVAKGSASDLAAFREAVGSAFAQGRGGVYDASEGQGSRTVAGTGEVITVSFAAAGGKTLTINPNADLWLAAFGTARPASGTMLLTNKQKGAKVFELTFAVKDGDAGEGGAQLGVCVLSRHGQSGTVKLTAKFSDRTERTLSIPLNEDAGSGNTLATFAAPPKAVIERLLVDGSEFSGDYVLLDDLGFVTSGKPQEGMAGSPPKTQGKPPGGGTPARLPRERLAEFVGRAFRRPVAAAEVERYHALFEQARREGKSEPDALRRAAQAVLASPSFLYLSEPQQPGQGAVRALDDHELACRLSYFLWSSMPDAELLTLARQGKLRDPDVLAAQVRRMLRDPKVRELSESFAVQWLRLDQLYTAKPDRKRFPRFYSGPQGKDTLHASMLTEALLLFETILVEDRSVLELVDADYSWLNARMMKLYGFEVEFRPLLASLAANGDPATPGQPNRELKVDPRDANNVWFRCRLPDRNRGGVLTMAGPLTVTSLPWRTSPVKRGAWLLETVFNRPPAEPKEAFALKDDEKEKIDAQSRTVRQRFEQHRTKAACYSCHNTIDPPGFALEQFDPVGTWRERDGKQPVDASGTWNGRDFEGPAEFKEALLARKDEFVRGFVEHLLGYALGRRLEHYDMPAVKEIQDAAARQDHRLAALVAEVVKSYPFRHVRN